MNQQVSSPHQSLATPVPTAAPRPPRAPDASMSLLRETSERAMDPGYASAAARRRATAADGQPRPPRSRISTAWVAVVAVALGLSASIAVITLRTPAPPGAREALAAEVTERRAAVTSASERVEALRGDVDARSDAALSGSSDDLVAANQASGLLSATSPVSGRGLRLSIDDAPGSRASAPGGDPREETAADQGRVLDRDLQVVTNGLFAAGAQAVSVSGHRLTSLSSIRVAGQAILVDYQPLTPPYVIEAVGDPDVMARDFADSSAGAYVAALEDAYGVQVTSTAHRSLQLPAGSVETLRHASVTRPVPAGEDATSENPTGEDVATGIEPDGTPR